jgi:hypothetical protein
VHLSEFQRRGLNVAAVSYDDPAVLRDFAARRGITFPLLSDRDSRVIRLFGIFNTTVAPDSFVYGVPFPGTYVLDKDLVVTAKYFEEKYAERVTASDILVRQFGAQPEAGIGEQETKHLRVQPSLSARAAIGGQKIALLLNIDIAPGIHVYAPGAQGYKPVVWEMQTAESNPTGPGGRTLCPARSFTEVQWPKPVLLHWKAIGETIPVYEKHLRLVREFTVPSDALLNQVTTPSGLILLSGTLLYQACDAKTCFNPESAPVQFGIQILQHDMERVPLELRRKTPVP